MNENPLLCLKLRHECGTLKPWSSGWTLPTNQSKYFWELKSNPPHLSPSLLFPLPPSLPPSFLPSLTSLSPIPSPLRLHGFCELTWITPLSGNSKQSVHTVAAQCCFSPLICLEKGIQNTFRIISEKHFLMFKKCHELTLSGGTLWNARGKSSDFMDKPVPIYLEQSPFSNPWDLLEKHPQLHNPLARSRRHGPG